jgi:mannan endo-1,4-beta-mannosidase
MTERKLLEDAAELITNGEWQKKFRNLITQPVNPATNDVARELLKKMYEWQIEGKTLSGQHEYLEAPYSYTGDIAKLTGQYPAIKGIELGGFTGQDTMTLAKQRYTVVEAAKKWHEAGGIVTATYHMAYPLGDYTWANVQRKTTQAEFDLMLTPGTTQHQRLVADIGALADPLGLLDEEDIPVLWRPFHEMNGGWFWWGGKKNFAKLWELMYDILVNQYDLRNLIWVWSPNAKNQWCDPLQDYFPGTDYVDILAADIYDNDFKKEHYDTLINLGYGKLIAIGENGQLPSAEVLKAQPYAYQMTWGKLLQENNSNDTIKAFHTLPNVLLRGGLQKTGDGLMGYYFSDLDFLKLHTQRVDPVVDFNWSGKPISGMPADNFTVRWSGYIVPKFTEEITFILESDDGVKLMVSDQLIINYWKNGGSTKYGKIKLEAGKAYPILLHYYESTGAAICKLSWQSASLPREIVPQSQLYSR